ncbi:Uncharacterised protein [Mycobacterium tuberculosis]|nr:Uncharacterised protein [Mycobacterium tuberculosis]
MASHTAAMPISIPAKIQNRDLAASIIRDSHPLTAAATEFSSVVSTCPCCASAGALARRTMPIAMKASSSFRDG